MLGYQIAEQAVSICNEKKEKIIGLSPPTDQKDLKRKLAFFQYFFPIAPRLNSILSPFRKFAKEGKRFSLTDKHLAAWDEAKTHLLDDKSTILRTPSSDVHDDIALFTDASQTTISCILTQMLAPVAAEKGKEKQLCIIGCCSSTIDEAWNNYPIWLLELLAFHHASHKFSWLLLACLFYVITDSTVVKMWASLDLVPKDLARKILSLQRFQYKVLYIDGLINPADCFSRPTDCQIPRGEYPRFLHNRIFNASNELIPCEQLFSAEKCEQARRFFVQTRKQTLSHAVDKLTSATDEVEEEEEERGVISGGADSTITQIIGDVDEKGGIETIIASIAALELDDEDVREGREEEEEDGRVDDDLLAPIALPMFDDARLQEIKVTVNKGKIK